MNFQELGLHELIEKGLDFIAVPPEWDEERQNYKKISNVKWSKLPAIKEVPKEDLSVHFRPSPRFVDIDLDHAFTQQLINNYFPAKLVSFGDNGQGHIVQEVADPDSVPEHLTTKRLDFPHPDLTKKTIIELRVNDCYSVARGKLDMKRKSILCSMNRQANTLPFTQINQSVYEIAVITALAIAYQGRGTRNEYLKHVIGEFKRFKFTYDYSEQLLIKWHGLVNNSHVKETITSLKGYYKKPDKYTTLDELPDWNHGCKIAIREWLKELAPEEVKEKTEVPQLEVFNGKNLFQTEFTPINWVVPDLLPSGLSVIASRPKVGKSWFALGLAKAVCNGNKFLGRETIQGDVLYCAFEDGQRRMNSRLKMLHFSDNMHFPSFVFDSEKLLTGFEEQVIEWIKQQKYARLIVIDTLIRVQGHKLKGGMNAYEMDSKMLSPLQKIAVNFNIAIVIVHHTKKKKDDDPFDDISGSTGIQGICDTLMHIQVNRGDKNTIPVLQVTGRDIESQDIAIKLNEQFEWEDLGDPSNAHLPKMDKYIIRGIKDLLDSDAHTFRDVTPKELCDYIKAHPEDYELSEAEKYTMYDNYKKKMQRMKKEPNRELVAGDRAGSCRNIPY